MRGTISYVETMGWVDARPAPPRPFATLPDLGYPRFIRIEGPLRPTPMPTDAINYQDLVEHHDQRLYGYFRARVGADQLARDLAQDTWTEVWPRIETYDPEIASFWRFTKNWAEIVLKRHWSGKSNSPIEWQPPEGDDELPSAIENQPADDLPLDVCVELSRALFDLLVISMSCERPPNELVVFGFSKLKWKPLEIVDELSDQIIGQLARRLESDYAALVMSPDLAKAFAPLHAKMELQITEVARDRRTRNAYSHVPEKKTGALPLSAYFPPDADPQAFVTRWWDTVRRTVFRNIQRTKPGSLSALLSSSVGDAVEEGVR